MEFNEQQFNNLLSGFLGALIAVIVAPIFERISEAKKLNRIRITIVDYLQYIGLDKSRQYITDIKSIKGEIESTSGENENLSVDALPMFSSDIFKSFTPDELRRVCFNSRNYISAIDISYSTDFLKSNMPLDIYNVYLSNVWKHFDEKGLETNEEQVKHLKECGILKQFEVQSVREVDAKLGRAITTHNVISSLLSELDGNGFIWFLKYLWRQ